MANVIAVESSTREERVFGLFFFMFVGQVVSILGSGSLCDLEAPS